MLLLLGENSEESFALGGDKGTGESHFTPTTMYKELYLLLWKK